MFFPNALLPVVLAVAGPAWAQPTTNTDGISPRAQAITVTLWEFNDCSHASHGPYRDYEDGTCLPLADSDTHAIKLEDWPEGCYILKYTGSRCDGDSLKVTESECSPIVPDFQSVKFMCD